MDFKQQDATPTLGQALQKPLEIPITGDSMRPLIQDGAILRVLPYPQIPIDMGDIVLFRREQSLVAHRVTAMKERDGENVVAERGDNSGVVAWRPLREVVGRVDMVRNPHWTLNPNLGAAYMIGRIMNFYWRTIKYPGRPKQILIKFLEILLKLRAPKPSE